MFIFVTFIFSFCRGNHYVKIFVKIPTSLTERQKELILEFAAEGLEEKERKQGARITIDEDDY